MSAAVLLASFCVCLASLYVSAYARVALQSVEKAELAREIRGGEQREQALNARISRLKLGSMVKTRAIEMRMEPNSAQTAVLVPSLETNNAPATGSAVTEVTKAPGSRKIIQ